MGRNGLGLWLTRLSSLSKQLSASVCRTEALFGLVRLVPVFLSKRCRLRAVSPLLQANVADVKPTSFDYVGRLNQIYYHVT